MNEEKLMLTAENAQHLEEIVTTDSDRTARQKGKGKSYHHRSFTLITPSFLLLRENFTIFLTSYTRAVKKRI